MDCTTCINRHNPFLKGYCRTMTEKPSKFRCHMTKEKALKTERKILAVFGNDKGCAFLCKKHIKFLEGLED